MTKFLKQIAKFVIPFIAFIGICLFLPTTPRASKSLLMANNRKDSLLQNTQGPRIIFIGGSNLSFGLNSQLIKDSLNVNPINTGIHAALGLKFMMDNTLPYIKSGDIVVLIPEYSHFYCDYNEATEELMRTVFDVRVSNIKHFSLQQVFNIMPFMPKYAISKLNPTEYFNVVESDVYSVNSFNKYGDTYKHWGKAPEPFKPFDPMKEDYNPVVMEAVKKFRAEIEKRNARLFVSFPGLQEASYVNYGTKTKYLETELVKNNFKVLGTPERYRMNDSMLFNTPYHLNKTGVDYRTRLFIEDFRKAGM